MDTHFLRQRFRALATRLRLLLPPVTVEEVDRASADGVVVPDEARTRSLVRDVLSQRTRE